MKIFFTSIGRRVELVQAFREAADRVGKELEIYGGDIVSTAPALSFCDHAIKLPSIMDAAYISTLIKICRDEKIDALIPTIDTDLLVLAKNKGSFGKTRVVVSEVDKVAISRDKRLTAIYFNSLGLKSPHPVDNYLKYSGGFPAFIKPRDGSSSISAYRVDSAKELYSYAKQIPGYIIQPYVDGTEYTVDIFCDFDGNPIYITPRIRLAVREGEVLKTQISQDAKIIEELKVLIYDFRPCGSITVQLIRESLTQEDYFIEINPRFGGGAPLGMKAGADSAGALLRLLVGERLSFVDGAAEDGAVFSRFDQSVRVR